MTKKKILFVCLGNICRSPSAEAVFKSIIKKKGLEKQFDIQSAGTYAFHEGEPADKRMQQHALKRGYDLTSISRPFKPDHDWNYFDYIIAMDNSNLSELRALARNTDDLNKIHKITDFSKSFGYYEVPDPYYGGSSGFELVLDLLEDAGDGLFEYILKKNNLK